MKPLRVIFLLLGWGVLTAVPAMAGPNSGGILAAHNPALFESATDGGLSLCNQGLEPSGYGDIVTRINGATHEDPAVWKVYCVFSGGSSPRLAGLTFGLTYDGSKLTIPRWGVCADFELPDAAWPLSGTGNSVLWDSARTGEITCAYWFTTYAYAPATVALGPHPTQGGSFADDSNPPLIDAVAGFGQMGFDTGGYLPPLGGAPGACCDRQYGACTMLTSEECGADIFKGAGVPCNPSPCTSVGACCDPVNFWCTASTRAQCDAVNGSFLGVETTCALEGAALCFIGGACCTPCQCSITLQDGCSAPGVWNGAGASCSPDPCSGTMTAACCNGATGACTMTIQAQCTGSSVWRCQWTACSPNPCPQPGACCSPVDGACLLRLPAECAAPGIFHPEWTVCSPNPCPQTGACCDRITSACALSLESDCSVTGIWHSDWHACSPNPCPPSAVPEPAPQVCPSLILAPNPFAAPAALVLRYPASGPATVEIADASGRLVRSWIDRSGVSGLRTGTWDGRDDAGRDLPAGVYLLRVVTEGGSITGRAVLLR
jgi:hypothetical protein